MEKNPKQLINEYCQRNKLPNPVYTCTPDNDNKRAKGYTCVLTFNEQTFQPDTPQVETTKKAAELVCARLACEAMKLSEGDATRVKPAKKAKKDESERVVVVVEHTADEQKELTQGETNDDKSGGTEKTVKPTEKEPGWISIQKVDDIFKYLSDEILSQEFKSFLSVRAQNDRKPYPVFTITDVSAPVKGYTCVCTYNGKEYHSLGVMHSKKQAEQSASEACLRELGTFPSVPKEQYTIQVYNGAALAPTGSRKVIEVA